MVISLKDWAKGMFSVLENYHSRGLLRTPLSPYEVNPNPTGNCEEFKSSGEEASVDVASIARELAEGKACRCYLLATVS